MNKRMPREAGSASGGKIGIFDSGLGGLVIAKAVIKKLPQYDYIYLGDTKRVPYGNRSQEAIYEFTKEALDFLFQQDCQLIILACNSASAMALRKIQREYLPQKYPARRVLGVIIPTLETVAKNTAIKRMGVLATSATVSSHIYKKELKKINPKILVFEQAAPLLVPLVENNSIKFASPILKSYLDPLLKNKVGAIVLGCTHYPILKKQIEKLIGPNVEVICQDEIIPNKLKSYLEKHQELESKLTKGHSRIFEVTDTNTNFRTMVKRLFGKIVKFKVIKY